jgi:hypothetical protein
MRRLQILRELPFGRPFNFPALEVAVKQYLIVSVDKSTSLTRLLHYTHVTIASDRPRLKFHPNKALGWRCR